MSQNNWYTIGHDRIKRLLDLQLASGRTAHAYLFLGAEGVGKRTLAEEFSVRLGALASGMLRFDFAEASVEGLRTLLQQAALRPVGANHQVVICDSAELMSQSSANALLKSLEEPASHTSFVLVAHRQTLLPTILSRCQVYNFGKLSRDQLRQIATIRGIEVNNDILSSAEGSASHLLRLSDPAASSALAALLSEYNDFASSPLFRRLGLAGAIAGSDTEELVDRITLWLGAAERTRDVTEARGVTRLKVLSEALVRLRQNANKKLVMEYIALNL